MTSCADPAEPRAGGGTLTGTVLCAGRAAGRLVRLDAPLSFWGGTDDTGTIVDRHHPARGTPLAGTVLAMPASRGSSSSSSVLAEQIRAGTAPCAVLLTEPDAIVALGVVVAAELYGRQVPVLLVERADLERLPAGCDVRVVAGDATGTVSWS